MKDYEMLQTKQRSDNSTDTTIKPKVDTDPFGMWGHEFVRTLSGEIGNEYNHRVLFPKEDDDTSMKQNIDPKDDAFCPDLLYMISYIVPYHIQHNAEAEAIDLLMEVQRLKLLLTLTTSEEDVKKADDDTMTTATTTMTDTTTTQTTKKIVDENNYERICLYLIKAADYMSDPEDLTVRFGFFWKLFQMLSKFYFRFDLLIFFLPLMLECFRKC
jgi:26S proteasome regulatory subunit N1